MTQKLSPYKISKMITLYFDGYSQLQIAEKLKMNQATVSLYVAKFEVLAEQYGLEAAGKEYGIMDQVKALHSLAAELKTAKLTVEEAKVGLKMDLVFQKCGIKPENYQELVQACTKMKSEGYIESAVKLSHLENSTGKTWEGIVTEAASAHQQLAQTQAQVASATGKLKAFKEQLAAIDNNKEAGRPGFVSLHETGGRRKEAGQPEPGGAYETDRRRHDQTESGRDPRHDTEGSRYI